MFLEKNCTAIALLILFNLNPFTISLHSGIIEGKGKQIVTYSLLVHFQIENFVSYTFFKS